jgi:hypothetical protein
MVTQHSRGGAAFGVAHAFSEQKRRRACCERQEFVPRSHRAKLKRWIGAQCSNRLVRNRSAALSLFSGPQLAAEGSDGMRRDA